ncbi:MAG TPA: cytochrome c oxidase assembly protein [Solirubrobacteraceae bacterium]|nr:cytochrome c oxidase assembly protein [Solirubrobacteraceae bacterium]
MIQPPALTLAPGVLVAVQLAALALLALLYGGRAQTLARTDRAVPIGRLLCFYAGLLLIGVLVAVGQSWRQLLLVHTLENLLLIDLAPLLLVLGLTAPLIAPAMRLDAARRARVLVIPPVAFALWAVDIAVWYLPGPYQAALEHPGWHLLAHVTFVLCGVLMWMCLFGPLPAPAWFGNTSRFLYILAVRLAGAVLGNVLLWSGTVFYLDYMYSDAVHHISPLADQNLAGAAVLLDCTLFAIGLFWWMFRRSAREGRERQDLLDYARRHGVPLSETRAARAIAAGRGSELRSRLEQRIGTLS